MGFLDFFRSKKSAGAGGSAARRGFRFPPRLAGRNFDMGEESRLLNDWNVGEQTADQAIFLRAEKMRARAQDLEKNDDMVRRFLRVMQDKVVGPDGFTYQARSRNPDGRLDKAANVILETAWEIAGKVGQYDVTRKLSREDGQAMTLRRLLVDGESIVRTWPGFANRSRYAEEHIDACRLDAWLNQEPGPGRNRITMGVEVDEFGAPLRYHFLPPNLGPYGNLLASRSGQHQVIEARFIRHTFIQERPGQTRGFTWLCSGGARKKLLDGMEKAVVVAARVAAAKMGFFTSKGDEYAGEGTDASGATIMSAEPGEFETLGPNMELLEWKPDFPPADVAALIKTFKQGLSSGLNVSYHTLASDLEGVNYTSSRTGELADRQFFRSMQGFLIRHECEPHHLAWLEMALLSGLVRLPIDKMDKFSAAEFWGCSWEWVDPLKMHQAQEVQHKLGRSLQSIHRENGWDWDSEQEMRAQEPNLDASEKLETSKPDTPAPDPDTEDTP